MNKDELMPVEIPEPMRVRSSRYPSVNLTDQDRFFYVNADHTDLKARFALHGIQSPPGDFSRAVPVVLKEVK